MPKISELSSVTSLTAGDVGAVVASNVTKKITAQDFVREACRLGFGDGGQLIVNSSKATATDAFTNGLMVDVTYSGNYAADGGGYDLPILQHGAIFARTTVNGSGGAGTCHTISAQHFSDGLTAAESESCVHFSQLYSESDSARCWGFDHHVHGPGPTKTVPNMMVGMACLMGNYHPGTITHGSHGIAVQAYPGIGPLWKGKEALTSYPHTAGFTCSGISSSGRGFDVAFNAGKAGGQYDGPWLPGNTSRIGTGFLAENFDAYGVYIGPKYSGATAYAFVSESGSGNVGFGVTTPAQQVEINGGLRLNTSIAKPTADSTSRGTLWIDSPGGASPDVLYVCLRSSGGAYSWKTVSTG